ncbi:MAG: Fe-S cluster assembly protein HesB [Nocardioidaceae bacterium]
MLTLTENASAIVTQITSQAGLGDTAGLRISANEAPEPTLELTAAPQAEPGDQVVERSGATVYLDESAAVLLDDKILDASVDASGKAAFALVEQGSATA